MTSSGNKNLYTVLQVGFPADSDAACLLLPNNVVISYGILHQESARYANLLVSLGVQPGDRVAVQVEKTAAAVFLYLGCLRAGAVFLPMNVAYQRHEIEHFLDDATPRLFVCRPESRALAGELAAKACVPHLLELGDDGGGSLAGSAAEHQDTFATVIRRGEDLAAILYTSGTTGRPKGAMLSHGNLAANAQVLHRLWGFRSGDVLLHMLPIFHAHGLFVAIHCALLNGSPMLFEPRFDAGRAVSLLPRATVFMGVPTYYVRLLAESGLTRQQCAGMRLFISGSAPLLKETFDDFKTRTGHTILERYGMTEGGMFTSNPYDDERRGGTVGFPLPGTTIRIVDDAGTPVKTGEVGNILVKGDQVFVGYWRMPEKTREEFTEDGYFKTGDMGRLDDNGYITIIGRSRDLIITGGLNVYPKEIEEMVDGIPGVVETAVIGRPDPDLGEVVTAVVVRQRNETGVSLTETGIISALKGTIAGFKVPKQVYFVDELPRNTMGKVQKNVLQQKVLSGNWAAPAEAYDEGRIRDN
ncbi:MAG: malonyl-CoA synthase [Desulfuromonadaceae bacterium]|nr:malonyl-CoA synthase [Desulfuromonadaceae bacterium]